MAQGDVYRIVTAEGHEYDYHGTVEQLKEAHPGATITGRRVVSEVGEGSYEPYSASVARADARNAAEADDADKPAAKSPVKPEKAAKKDEDAA